MFCLPSVLTPSFPLRFLEGSNLSLAGLSSESLSLAPLPFLAVAAPLTFSFSFFSSPSSILPPVVDLFFEVGSPVILRS
jgi:hypothetical protein